MVDRLYIIYDLVAQMLFGAIIRVSNDEVARRSFHDALAAKDSPFANHQGDYVLLYIGDIDEQTGIITPTDNRHPVASGKDWLDANKEGLK